MSWCLVLLVGLGSCCLVSGCGDPPLLQLGVVTPEGPDPFESADRLRLVVTQPAAETVTALGSKDRFTVELKTEVESSAGSVLLEGLAGETLVARGETPPMVLRPEDRRVSILVGRAGAVSTLRARLTTAAGGSTAVLVPSLGVLLAGGHRDGQARTDAAIYDFFRHTVRALPAQPEARAEAVGASCGGSCALILLGAASAGMAERTLRFDGTSWTSIPDGLASADRRKGATIALLDDGSYLIAGGEGASGPQGSLLLLDPGTVERAPALTRLSVLARAARSRPAMAASGGVVLLAGGQGEGAPVAELFYRASSTGRALDWVGPALRSDAAAIDLADGRLAVVGGRDSAGALLRDAWVVDPASGTVTHVADALSEGRAEHQLVRSGKQLLVAGGMEAVGPAAQVVVLDATLLRPIGQPLPASPRLRFSAMHLGPGCLLLAGGQLASGAPVDLLEVYQTSAKWTWSN